MSDLILTKNELYQLIKKRKIETDQIDGKNTEEDINELIINNETDKYLELFNKVFCEEENELLDSEDGFVKDLFTGIVIRIKEKLTKLGSSNKSQLLNFVFKFLKDIVIATDGEDKSSSA